MKALKLTTSLFIWISLCVGARADLVLESQFGFEARPLYSAYTDREAQITDTPSPVRPLNVPWLYRSYIASPESEYGLGQLPQTPPPKIAEDSGNSSFSLCLSALLSLGLCHSIHGVKKLSFEFSPQWYHTGGSFQIGHSIAVGPDSVCPVTVCCFIQPTFNTEYHPVQRNRLGIIISLWREAQFTPDSLASRGPPPALE